MAGFSPPDFSALNKETRRSVSLVLDDFLDQILSPSLSLLLAPPEEDVSNDSTGSLVQEWMEANGYEAAASSLREAMATTPLTTAKTPHKNRLETRLQDFDARFRKQRAMVLHIYEASVSMLSLLQEHASLMPEIDDGEDVQPSEVMPEADDGMQVDVDGEPVEAEEPVAAPIVVEAEEGEIEAALRPPSKKRHGSLSDYSSPEPSTSGPQQIVPKKINDGPPALVNINMVCKRNGKGDEGCTRPTCHFRHCSPAWRKNMGVAMIPTELICPSERINLGMPTPCIDAFCKLAHRSAGFYRPELDVKRREKVAYGQGNLEPTSQISRKHPYEVMCKRGDDCKLAFCMFRHPRDGILKLPGSS